MGNNGQGVEMFCASISILAPQTSPLTWDSVSSGYDVVDNIPMNVRPAEISA